MDARSGSMSATSPVEANSILITAHQGASGLRGSPPGLHPSSPVSAHRRSLSCATHPWHDVSAILHQLIQIRQVMSSPCMRIKQVRAQVTQRVEDRHVQACRVSKASGRVAHSMSALFSQELILYAALRQLTIIILRTQRRSSQLAQHRRSRLQGLHEGIRV